MTMRGKVEYAVVRASRRTPQAVEGTTSHFEDRFEVGKGQRGALAALARSIAPIDSDAECSRTVDEGSESVDLFAVLAMAHRLKRFRQAQFVRQAVKSDPTAATAQRHDSLELLFRRRYRDTKILEESGQLRAGAKNDASAIQLQYFRNIPAENQLLVSPALAANQERLPVCFTRP